MRQELAKTGVKVTCIQPGDVRTELLSHTTDTEVNFSDVKAGKHLTFVFLEHVKFLSTSRKCKYLVRTLPLVAIDSILANVDYTCERIVNPSGVHYFLTPVFFFKKSWTRVH